MRSDDIGPATGGRCTVCGHDGPFGVSDVGSRENFWCQQCHASARYRLQAAALLAVYGSGHASCADLADQRGFRELAIYEPGISGSIRPRLKHLPRYVNSYFWDGVARGATHDGVRCEDLENLTFPDASFDIVITSDIFEHIRHPFEAFGEVWRVLKPGGRHIFTVPFTWPFSPTSFARVDTTGVEDVHLVPPAYHGSPVDPRGSLVYTDFGLDLPERLRHLGYETAMQFGYRNNAVVIATRPSGR